MLAWASGALYLPDAMAAAVMSTSRANPVWETVTRWTRRLGA
jgi:putative heme iron utilization protein